MKKTKKLYIFITLLTLMFIFGGISAEPGVLTAAERLGGGSPAAAPAGGEAEAFAVLEGSTAADIIPIDEAELSLSVPAGPEANTGATAAAVSGPPAGAPTQAPFFEPAAAEITPLAAAAANIKVPAKMRSGMAL